MSKEGPGAETSILARPFVFFTSLVLQNARATIAVALALAALSTVITWLYLGYRTNRQDLLSPDSPYNRLWREFVQEFGEEDDAVVVVEGPGREAVTPVLDSLAEAIRRDERQFHDVFDGVELGRIKTKGLHYLPPESLGRIEGFVRALDPIIGPRGSWAGLSAAHTLGGYLVRLQQAAASPDSGALAPLAREAVGYCDSLLVALEGRPDYHSPWPELQAAVVVPPAFDTRHLLAKEGRCGFIFLRLKPSDDPEAFARSSEAADALRAIVAQERARHPEVQIGLTGLPIMENDEMRSSQASMVWASVLSMIGVAVLFVAGLGGVRHALLANLILLIGMAWSFAYVTLSVGHLNILSVSFTATLIGIGIDYGIYYASRYLQLRRDGLECEPALLETARTAGPAISTGAITTAVAFFAAGLTKFTGVAELGVIAGGGLLLCALSELIVLPASIFLIDRSGWGIRMPAPLPVHRWVAPFVTLPRLTLLLTCGVTAYCGQGLTRLRYDNNLLNMQAKGLESVALEERLLNDRELSSWYAVSVCESREQLLERKARFEQLACVDRTEEIVSLIPDAVESRQASIDRIFRRLQLLPEAPPVIPVDRPQQLGQVLSGLQQTARNLGESQLSDAVRKLNQVSDNLSQAELARRLAHFQQQVATDLMTRLSALKAVSNPNPPRLSDLPKSLTNRYVGKHGRHLLKIYGAGNTWNSSELDHFAQELRKVDPRVTGNPLQAREASLEMKSSYQEAAVYALLVIMGVLIVDFRNLRDALLASLPLALGMVQSFGIMGLLDIPLNPANLIALPLILGIGVDYGVHIVHEFREHGGPYRITAGTAVAVLVDALTTIVGYGAMMIATHQGLQSLGRVLTLSVTCCLLNSLVALPALLALLSRHRASADTTPRLAEATADDQAEPTTELITPRARSRGRAAA